jgi:uncharacterized Zn finger protein
MMGDKVSVNVFGSEPEPYRVTIHLNGKEWKYGHCTCPAELHPCKHIVATLLKYVRDGVDSIDPPFKESVKNIDAQTLRLLLVNLVDQDPDLLDDIQSHLIELRKK